MAAAPKKAKPHKKSQEITYGLLIDILEEVEKECSEDGDIPCQLIRKVQIINPDVTVGRESRFYETVKRIAAPTRPSLRGECKLMGSAAQEYREKVWVPRVRNNCNNVQAASTLQFPKDLVHYGLTEMLLETVFTEVECYKGSLSMFFHVYGDLVMLAKSNELKKTTLDMNPHYLELHTFLCRLEDHPDIIMDSTLQVFHSEKRLYESNSKTNHRMKEKSLLVHKCLFSSEDWDSELLLYYISLGASSMKAKLSTYAANQLPGGIYWDPEPKVQAVLKELSPSNDICKSILGLNDYLRTSIPNSHQIVRSNLVQAKKNHTIKWLDELSTDDQDKLVNLAVTRRATVMLETKEEEQLRSERRRAKLLREHAARQAVQERARQQLDKLHEMHLITSVDELREIITKIDQRGISNTRKKREKMDVLRTQINIRKKLLRENIRIPLSHNQKQRPVTDIQKDLVDYMVKNPLLIVQPDSLVGKRIQHRFEIGEDNDYWYNGTITSYDPVTHLHEVSYDGEDDHQFFELLIDIIIGDLVITIDYN